VCCQQSMRHQLRLYRCGGGELMGQRKSALPIGALPITPRQALPIAPLSQQDEALRDANDAVIAVLQYMRAKRTTQTARATETRKQRADDQRELIREDWTARMSRRAAEGRKRALAVVDRVVAIRFDVDIKTVRRATEDLRK
jgi:hypothetical protein